MTLDFRVIGIAQPMGSKQAFTPPGWSRPIITDSNRNLKSWQQLVRHAANDAMQHLPTSEQRLFTDGVRLTIAFYLPRPKALAKRNRPHIHHPDLDKCVRSIQDALTGIAYRDDSQVVDLVAMKRYAALGDVPHVDISVEPCAGIEPLARDQPLFALVR